MTGGVYVVNDWLLRNKLLQGVPVTKSVAITLIKPARCNPSRSVTIESATSYESEITAPAIDDKHCDARHGVTSCTRQAITLVKTES